MPGLSKIFKDLHRDIPGIDAIKEATVWRRMESGGAEGKGGRGGDGEENIYLIPSETLVLSICGNPDKVKLMLGNGKQRPRARREKRGCWVGVCRTLPSQRQQ